MDLGLDHLHRTEVISGVSYTRICSRRVPYRSIPWRDRIHAAVLSDPIRKFCQLSRVHGRGIILDRKVDVVTSTLPERTVALERSDLAFSRLRKLLCRHSIESLGAFV